LTSDLAGRGPARPATRTLRPKRVALIAGKAVGVLVLAAFLYSEAVVAYAAASLPGTGEGVPVHPRAYLIHGREAPAGFREIPPSGPWLASSDYRDSTGGCTRTRSAFRTRHDYLIAVELTACRPIAYANDLQWASMRSAQRNGAMLTPGPLPGTTNIVTA